ncbi:cytochrome ubiquinol oxidase subunit I, partial [Streptomyces sp. NPDC052701]
ATSCPPPRHNFTTLPKIRSESPAFDLHHPDVAQWDEKENVGKRDVIDAAGHESDRS